MGMKKNTANWAVKQSSKYIKKAKNAFLDWADDFESGKNTREKFNKLSPEDKAKAKVHIQSHATVRPPNSNVIPPHENVNLDLGAKDLREAILQGRTRKKQSDAPFVREKITEKDSYQNLKFTESDNTLQQDERFRINKSRHGNSNSNFKAEFITTKPHKILNKVEVKAAGNDIDRWKDRDAIKELKEMQLKVKEFKKKQKKSLFESESKK